MTELLPIGCRVEYTGWLCEGAIGVVGRITDIVSTSPPTYIARFKPFGLTAVTIVTRNVREASNQ